MRYLHNRTLAVSLMLGIVTGLMAPMQRTTGATFLGDSQPLNDMETSIETSIETQGPSPILTARDVEQEDLEGTWEITDGETPDDNDYEGTVEISAIRDTSNLYNLFWETSAGDYTGLGFLEEDRLLVGYGLSDDIYGVALYEMKRNGTLQGRWTYSEADGAVGTEIARGGIRGRLEGDYKIEGTDPGDPDSSYNGLLRINKVDDIYQVSWTVEDQILLGIGLRVDDWLIVGWGPGDSFAVMDYEIDDDKAKGRSAMSGEADLGKEKLRRED